MRTIPSTLLCTVGTSLFFPNLAGLTGDSEPELAEAYKSRDWDRMAAALAERDPKARLCGAEINSIEHIIARGFSVSGPRLVFFHSDTEDGGAIARVLESYFTLRGFETHARRVEDLQDADPARFASRGLRALARGMCEEVRRYSAAACAINATGGYKAQIAIAVMLGQALGIPVYYKHERFDEIIAFPPMPVALDFDLWMGVSGLLFDLARETADAIPLSAYDQPPETLERLESLLNVIDIDGTQYIELSATGLIFHETFRERFHAHRAQLLPPPAKDSEKRPPHWEASGHMRDHPEVMRFMERLSAEVPQVKHCHTFYFNPDLPRRTCARLGARGIEVVYSDGTATIKIGVQTTADNEAQQKAVVAAISEWMGARQG